MAVRVGQNTDTVKHCAPRQDGGWLIVTRKGAAGSSDRPLSEGSRVVVRGGVALPA